MPQPIRQGRCHNGSNAVRSIPRGHAEGLLSPTIPLRGDDGEQRKTAGLEQAEEEARSQQRPEVVAGGERGGRDAPAEDERRHEDAVRHPHDEDARERLPRQLGDGRDGTEQRVLAPREPRRLLQPERRRVPEHRLVEDLQEVHPDQEGQDRPVRLPPDPLILMLVSSIGQQARKQASKQM